jgi:hypothetical protein
MTGTSMTISVYDWHIDDYFCNGDLRSLAEGTISGEILNAAKAITSPILIYIKRHENTYKTLILPDIWLQSPEISKYM